MRAATQQDPPEAAGPGTAHPDGLVTYGPTTTPGAPPFSPRAEPPEAAGPATEHPGGSLTYGVPGLRSGPMPLPTPAERERGREIAARLIASCGCAVIPGGVLAGIAELTRAARISPSEGIGCPRCRGVPPGLVDQLAQALEVQQ